MEWVLSIMAGLVTMRYTFRWFFIDWRELADSLKHWFKPTSIWAARGHLGHSFWVDLKFFIWLLLGILAGIGSYQFLVS